MEIFYEIKPLRAFLNTLGNEGKTIGLVPTMGALHQGHISLLKACKSENDLTVCSIYVNPTQFNNAADLTNYPRTLELDKKLLIEAGCDALFCPGNDEMYNASKPIRFDFGELDKILEGKFRPGHFSGVALAVSKLFNIVLPARAYFGQKDYQQFKVISKLVEELKFNIELRSVPIFREPDGLAMSSRNLRLSEAERKSAAIFFEALKYAKEAIKQKSPVSKVRDQVKKICESKEGVRLEYFELVNGENLIDSNDVSNADEAIMLIAGYVGEVRLIDNMLLS
jgi:pantoate--beta-alanine ligase